MSKSPDAFRSIGEVSRLVGVPPHVLRYWETQFPQLAPVKRADGRRYYRPDDVRLAAGLCQVMREEGLSIRGARRLIAEDRGLALRGIGAARLGEELGQIADRPAAAPAMRLAVPQAAVPEPALPEPALAEIAAPQTATIVQPADTQTDSLPAMPRAPRRVPKQAESLPLFDQLGSAPAPDWLTRLTAAAARLRHHELQGQPLSDRADQLRTALRRAR